MNGFYCHPRRVFEQYISRPEYFAVAGVLLYNARFTSAVENGIRLSPGQLLIKLADIADMCGITVSQVRSALDCFIRDGGIKTQSCGKRGLLITLLAPFCAQPEKRSSYQGGSYSKKQADTYTPDPNASYDLKRAEERARQQVPKIKKRD